MDRTQVHYTAQVVPAEWRWVIQVGSLLVLLAFAPFFIMALSGISGTQWQFMGILNNPRDGASYLSKMALGANGAWLVYFQHTPEPHDGAFIQIVYILLGNLARVTSLPPIVMFHIARVGASLFMYMAFYYLAATIWLRMRTRRIFFLIASIGSGVGWLFGPLTGQATLFPDLALQEAFGFYSTLANPHFPLTLGCLALLMSVLISSFRPGFEEAPDVKNGGLAAAGLSVLLGLLYPQTLVPLVAALGFYVLYCWYHRRRLYEHPLRWFLVVVAPIVPLATYYVSTVQYNPAMAEWNRQNVTLTPPPIPLLLGFGLPLLLALPGIYRAVRHFEPDGDQLMILWLLAIMLAIYAPVNVQRRFAVGLMIPIAYFATRALEDFWLRYLDSRWRYHILAAGLLFVTISHLFVLFLPVLPLATRNFGRTEGLFLEQDYAIAFDWLRRRIRSDDVVLASPTVSIWLPAWTGGRVVYGHDYETLDAETKRQAVLAWYGGTESDCETLLNGGYAFIGTYRVRYVIYGPQEQQLGTAPCLEELDLAVRFGDVAVYGS